MPLPDPLTQARSARSLTQQEKIARSYEEEVYPLLGQKQADLLTAGFTPPPCAHGLQIGCGLGTTTGELLHRLDADSRVIAVETSSALLDRARANVAAEQLGRRIFFRAHDLDSKLPFADGGFDFALANVALSDLSSPSVFRSELMRVAKPGSEIRLATLLAGTWREFLDVYADILVRLRKNDAVEALAAYKGTFPEPEELAGQLEAAGAASVAVETVRWELVFRTGREFFYAPVIELGPLARWKAIVGKGPAVQDTFLAVKGAIDAYFAGMAFGVSVYAGVFTCVKG